MQIIKFNKETCGLSELEEPNILKKKNVQLISNLEESLKNTICCFARPYSIQHINRMAILAIRTLVSKEIIPNDPQRNYITNFHQLMNEFTIYDSLGTEATFILHPFIPALKSDDKLRTYSYRISEYIDLRVNITIRDERDVYINIIVNGVRRDSLAIPIDDNRVVIESIKEVE